MIVEPADRRIVRWAMERSAPFYYAREKDLPSPCLKVHCGYVTAYFCRGRLTRVWAHADRTDLDHMFCQLMQVFEACGRPRTRLEDTLAVLDTKKRLRPQGPPGV